MTDVSYTYRKTPESAVDIYNRIKAESAYRREQQEQRAAQREAERQAKLYEQQQREAALQEQRRQQQEAQKNNGGLIGGIGYTVEKLGLGALRTLEGIWDWAAGGIADLFGAHDWAKAQMENDWVNYNHADEWYNPGDGWKFVGDVAGGVGQMLPSIAVTAATGGAGAPAMVTNVAGMGTFMAGAAGNAVSEATKESGELGGKEWLYGTASGAMEGAIESISGGIGGTKFGTVLGKKLGKTTAGKLATTFVGEGLEEVASDLLDPALRRVTGVDKNATVDWGQLPHTFLVGGTTGAVLGGGRRAIDAKRAGGFNNLNAAETAQEIRAAQEKGDRLQAKGKLTESWAKVLGEQQAENATRLSERLKKMDAQDRATLIESNNLSYLFDESGNLKQAPETATANVNGDAYSYSLRGREGSLIYQPTSEALTDAQKSAVQSIEKISDGRVKTVIADNLTDGNGNKATALYQDGVIYIDRSANAATVQTIHEITHSLEGTEAYGDFVQFAFDEIKSSPELTKRYGNYLERYAKTAALYEGQTQGENARKAQYVIQTELAAQYAADMFGNEEFIKRLSKARPNVAQRIWQWIKDKIRLLKAKGGDRETLAFLQKAEKLYRKALSESVGGVKLSELQFEDEADTEIDVIGEPAEARFSIQKVNGKNIVVIDTDQNIFDNVPRSEYGKVVRQYMKEHFRGRTVDGVKFNKRSESEYTGSEYTKAIYGKGLLYDTKLRAATELENLIKMSKFLRHETAKHPHGYNVNGYNRYATQFILDGKIFSGEMLVALSDQGGAFYDIVKIKESGSTNREVPKSVDSASIESIAQDNASVKSIREKSEKDSGGRYSLVGESAKNTDQASLAEAKRLASQGVTDLYIFRKTGWFRGVEGKWRAEIDDSRMKTLATKIEALKLKPSEIDLDGTSFGQVALSEIVEHDALFEAYPELKDLDVEFEKADPKTPAEFVDEKGNARDRIILRTEEITDQTKESLLHEIQHWIQKREGFAQGSSSQYWQDVLRRRAEVYAKSLPAYERLTNDTARKRFVNAFAERFADEKNAYKKYYHTAGEQEARNVSERSKLTTEERRAKMPFHGDENTVLLSKDARYSLANNEKSRYNEKKNGENDDGRERQEQITGWVRDRGVDTGSSAGSVRGMADLQKRVGREGSERIASQVKEVVERPKRLDKYTEELAREHAKKIGYDVQFAKMVTSERSFFAEGEYLFVSDEITADKFGRILDRLDPVNRKVETGKTAHISVSRWNKFLELHGDGDVYVAKIPIQDFLDLTADRLAQRDIREQTAPLEISDLKASDQLYLKIDFENGKVLDHEGRHRLTALFNAGYQNADVMILAENADRAEYDRLVVRPQENAGGKPVALFNIVSATRPETRAFAAFQYQMPRDSDVRYSLKEKPKSKTETETERVIGQISDQLQLDFGASKAEIADLLTVIRGDVQEAFAKKNMREGAYRSLYVKYKDKYYRRIAENRLTNQILDKAQFFKDVKKRTSADVLADPELEAYVKNLSGIKHRSDIRKSDTRKRVAMLDNFYTQEKLATEGEHSYYDQNVRDAIDFLKENVGSIKPLSFEELQAVNVVLGGIRNLYRTYDVIRRNGKNESLTEMAERGIATLESAKKYQKRNWVSRKLFEIGTQIVEPRVVIEMMEGYQNGAMTRLFDDLTAGETKAQSVKIALLEEVDAFLKEHKKYERHLREKIPFQGVEISVDDALQIYLTAQREAAKSHLQNGGVSVETEKGVKDFRNVTEADVSELYAKFTEEDKAFLEIARRMFNEKALKVKIETDNEILGYTNVSETNDYIPMRTDRTTIARGVADARNAVRDLQNVYNFSFNKDVKPNAKNQLAITGLLGLMQNHAAQLGIYAGLTQPLQNFDKFYNKNLGTKDDVRSVKKTLNREVWSGADKYISDLLQDVQGSGRQKSAKVLSRLRGGYAKFQLGLNGKVILSQTASYPSALQFLSGKSMTRALGMKWDGANLDKYSDYARVRNYNSSIVLAEGVMDHLDRKTEIFTKPIQKTDRLTVGVLWNACRVEVETKQGFALGTEENYQAAASLFEEVCRKTQPNYSATERSALMRSESELLRTMTMFTSVPLKQISRTVEAWGKYLSYRQLVKDGKVSESDFKAAKQNLMRATTSTLLANAMYVGIGLLFKWLLGRKDEEGNELDYLNEFGKDLLGTYANMIPIFRDVYGALANDYEINNYAFDSVNNLVDSTKQLWNLVDGLISGRPLTEADLMRPLRSSAYAVGQLFGIPVRNVWNQIYGLTKRFSPETAFRMNALFTNNLDYAKEIKRALEGGNKDYAMTVARTEIKRRGVGGKVADELAELYIAGESVMPKKTVETVTIDGKEISLTTAQIRAFNGAYKAYLPIVESMISSKEYRALDAAGRAKAVKFIEEYYYAQATESTLNVPRLTAKQKAAALIPAENLAIYLATIALIQGDTDKNGNVVSGSRKKKVFAYINKLPLTAAQKYVLMGLAGYKNEKGKEQTERLIRTKVRDQETVSELLKASGY